MELKISPVVLVILAQVLYVSGPKKRPRYPKVKGKIW